MQSNFPTVQWDRAKPRRLGIQNQIVNNNSDSEVKIGHGLNSYSDLDDKIGFLLDNVVDFLFKSTNVQLNQLIFN